jgi:predicted ATPase/DNA-binding SARP family transcriptional activator
MGLRYGRTRVLDIRLLSGFAVQVDGAEVPDDAWRLRKARALVKLLALAPGNRMHRDQACALLWPGKEDARALNNNLHQAVYAARRALDATGADGAAMLALRDDVLSLSGEVTVDAVQLEGAIAAARADGGARAYEAALANADGELLPEDRYEDWANDRRDALRELVTTAYLELADLQELPDSAAEVLQRALAFDPLHERATRSLMRAYADAGRRQRALEAFEHLRSALLAAYAADPDEETRRLYRELLAAGDGAEPAGDAPLRLPLTSFVGRERELGEVARLLDRTRLLTITGPGGSGKTRLALEAAARQQGNACLVELAPLADPALLCSPVAAALGVSVPTDADPVEALANAIGTRELLLVLDNCEHLINPAAELAAGLLPRCPGLRILATSREPLHIDGEVAWRAPSLSLPGEDEDPRASEAVRLFADRAAAAAPELELGDEDIAAAAAICRRLDGMPLAIELAAARIRHLSPGQLAERLGTALDVLGTGSRTALDRQQTLRATLDWSYALLDEDERALFAALSVFAGDFDIVAAEAVGGESLDVLGRLVDKSLVLADRQGPHVRYRLLETFRQYGHEHLADPATPLAAHRRHYLALAERLAPSAELGEDDGWIRALTAEHPNLRAAIASGLRDDPEEALRLVTALGWFWLDGGHLVEGLRWYARALEARPERDNLRVRALAAAGSLEFRRGRHAGNFEYYPELLAVARERCHGTELARALLLTALCGFMTSRWDQALESCAEIIGSGDPLLDASARYIEALTHSFSGSGEAAAAAFAQARELVAALPDDHPPVFTVLLIGLAVVHDFGAPRPLHEETLATFRDCGPRQAEAYMWLAEAQFARFARDHDTARRLAGDAVERFRALDDRRGTALALGAASCIARSAGDVARARELLLESQELRRATGDTRLIGIGMGLEALLEAVAGEPARARTLFMEVEERFTRQGDTPALGGALLNRGTFELAQGELATARELIDRSRVLMRYQHLDRTIAWADIARADVSAALGDMAAAHTLLDGARAEMERLGEPGGPEASAAAEARLQSPLSSS